MKKVLTILMAALMVIAMMSGCSSSKKDAVTGKWTMTKATFAGVEQDPTQLKMSMSLEFKNGKVKVVTESQSYASGPMTGESEYKLDGNTVTITDADGTQTTATVDGDTMTLNQDNVEFTLVRGDGAAADSSTSEGEATPEAEATPAE